MKRVTLVLYYLSLFCLLIYSYSQVDLNLTLSSNSFYQHVQHQLTLLGYFNRPLSTLIYSVILSMLFITYILLIHQAKKGQLSSGNILKILPTTSIILLLSYPAFSHDLFNYIFDARIMAFHHANPWTHTALDFPGDLWTRFMHWTHRTYPYGPAWLLITLPVYFLGFDKFTLTLVNFKLLGAGSYLLACYSIFKIGTLTNTKSGNLSLAIFAFNPLIIIESLVTSHLDITMTAIMLFAIYLKLSAKQFSSWVLFFFAAAVKYISIASLPIHLFYSSRSKRLAFFVSIAVFLSAILTLLVISQREILPWYVITPLALASLVPRKKNLQVLSIGLSFGLMLRYTPFLYFGEYTPQVHHSEHLLTLIGFLISIPVTRYLFFQQR